MNPVKLLKIATLIFATSFVIDSSDGSVNMFDLRYWTCYLKKTTECPDNEIRFYLYMHATGKERMRIDVRNKFALRTTGWDAHKNNVIIVHGFNGTESKSPITILRDAYLTRNDYNVFTVDWMPLCRFPCYVSSLSNTRLVAKCAAQLYAFIMDNGGLAKRTTCVGHSLGAHICGMMSNHLHIKQYRIVGLDPARPLVAQFARDETRLDTKDAYHVQVIHTNAGRLGELHQRGHVDFCVNGGMTQPSCKGHRFRIARCSHVQSVCFFAWSVSGRRKLMGHPCASSCPQNGTIAKFSGKSIPMGIDTPISATGTYCVETSHHEQCAFNVS